MPRANDNKNSFKQVKTLNYNSLKKLALSSTESLHGIEQGGPYCQRKVSVSADQIWRLFCGPELDLFLQTLYLECYY